MWTEERARPKRQKRRAAQATAPAAPPITTPASPVSPDPVIDLKPKIGLSGLFTAGLVALATYLIFRRQIEDAIVQTKTTVAEGQGEGPTRYMPLVISAANAANVPPHILAGIVSAESNWSNKPNSNSEKCNVSCVSGKVLRTGACAIGLAQVLPTTANMSAEALCNPANSLIAGARYLRILYNKYQDERKRDPGDDVWTAVRKAYNAGPGNYDNGNIGSGTVAYADKAERWANKFREQGIAGLGRFQPRPRFSALRMSIYTRS